MEKPYKLKYKFQKGDKIQLVSDHWHVAPGCIGIITNRKLYEEEPTYQVDFGKGDFWAFEFEIERAANGIERAIRCLK